MTAEERTVLLQVLQESADNGHSDTLDQLWMADYSQKPVDIETFFKDDYFLGHMGRAIYPAWMDIHVEIEEKEYPEVIFTGSLGYGKTFNAVLHMTYDIYRLSCLHNPQVFYGLAHGSPIVLGLYNVFKYKVDTTSYPVFRSAVEGSPYFRERFAVDPNNTNTMRFPNKVRVISGSSELHAIGDNLYGALIDEANFMKEGKSKKSNDDAARSQAMSLHQSISRRMESRFAFPGRLYLVSSKKFHSSYTSRYIKENHGNPRIGIYDRPLWEMKPHDFYTAAERKPFKVVVGDAYNMSRILEEGEEAKDTEHVIEVPTKHKPAFVQDVEAALRDIAGVETFGTRPLITNREKIFACVDKALTHPFTCEAVPCSFGTNDSIEDLLQHKALFRVLTNNYVPRLNRGALRYVHIDLGLTGDFAGFAMGHVSGAKKVARAYPDGTIYRTIAPIITIEMMARLYTEAKEIDLAKIRLFLVALRSYGYSIRRLSFDGFQSADSFQLLKKEGFDAAHLSVDRTDEAYSYLKQGIMEERVRFYQYAPFLDELVNLEHDRDKGKVDHPDKMHTLKGDYVKGSKDVSDAVAGVMYHCLTSKASYLEQLDSDSAGPANDPNKVVPQPVKPIDDHGWVVSDYSDLHRIQGIT